MSSYNYFLHFVRRFQENNNDCLAIVSGDKGSGKSTLTIGMAKEYVKKFGFICPHCKTEFYKNLYKSKREGNSIHFYVPDKIKIGEIKIQCPEYYELNLKTGMKEKISGCGKIFIWSERKRIKWDAEKFIAYSNSDARKKILNMPKYSPLIFDEAMNFMCLTEDTLIKMPRNLKTHKFGVPIKELVGRKNFTVYSFDTKNEKLCLSNCHGCYYVGKEQVYELELTNGFKIQATKEHKFITMDGDIKQLKDLVWFKDGVTKRYLKKKTNEKPIGKTKQLGSNKLLYEFSDRLRVFSENISHNTRNQIVIDNKKVRMAEHRFIYNEINGEIPDNFVVHHKNNNPLNNKINNLEGMSLSKHSSYTIKKIGCPHKIISKEKENFSYGYDTSSAGKKGFGSHSGVIKSIKYVGIKSVYSLVEVEKNHNYFANNMLVKNSAMDHNKTESKEMKKLFTVVRPRRLFMMANIPELTWIDSKYREIMSHFWIYCINKGVAFIMEKDKAVTKDKWHLKELSKILGTIKYFTGIDKIKRNIKKHPCYSNTITWGELPSKFYDNYELVRNAHNLREQVEEMAVTNNDLAKIMCYNLLYHWDRIHQNVIRGKKNSITYNVLRNDILINPVTKLPMASETTVRNWVIGVEEFVKTKGDNASFIAKK